MLVFFECHPFISLSVTLIVFQGHNIVKQFKLKVLCSYPIKLKLCTIVDYVKYIDYEYITIFYFRTCSSGYIFIVGFMTLTLFQGRMCVRNVYCTLRVLDSGLMYFECCLVATYIKKIMHNTICVIFVYSRETINMVFGGQVSGLAEKVHNGINSDTIM